LGSTGNYVLDEVSVSWGINDCAVVLGCLELPEGDINRDSSFSLGLEVVEHPGEFESTLTHLVGLFLELLDGSLINSSELVDQVNGVGGLSRVDMSNND